MHTSAHPATPPAMRYRSAGAHQPPIPTDRIEQEAQAAAQANQSLCEACPYPFDSEAGNHFAAIWYLHTYPSTASVNPRPKAI